jgi:hypothetical protein
MKAFVRNLLWELIMTSTDKDLLLERDIDRVIEVMVESSRYTDREDGENYPIWNENEVTEEIHRIKEALIKKGFDKKFWFGYK